MAFNVDLASFWIYSSCVLSRNFRRDRIFANHAGRSAGRRAFPCAQHESGITQ
jgi:hypothetical protein